MVDGTGQNGWYGWHISLKIYILFRPLLWLKKTGFWVTELNSILRCFNLASPGMFSALNMIVIHMDKLSMNYNGVSARAMSPLTKRLETTSIWYVGVTFQVACILPGCHTFFFSRNGWLSTFKPNAHQRSHLISWCPCLTHNWKNLFIPCGFFPYVFW